MPAAQECPSTAYGFSASVLEVINAVALRQLRGFSESIRAVEVTIVRMGKVRTPNISAALGQIAWNQRDLAVSISIVTVQRFKAASIVDLDALPSR